MRQINIIKLRYYVSLFRHVLGLAWFFFSPNSSQFSSALFFLPVRSAHTPLAFPYFNQYYLTATLRPCVLLIRLMRNSSSRIACRAGNNNALCHRVRKRFVQWHAVYDCTCRTRTNICLRVKIVNLKNTYKRKNVRASCSPKIY